ncbi:LTA synthase family protein [uncultured Victivallis sp.]|uniref:LTA synthase family protein n=1 Tax=Victivallis sp. TaxID=2049020 RepID=UPI0025DA5C8C|nr:LTA synthase family protein [uncultured Victivallis sp.]
MGPVAYLAALLFLLIPGVISALFTAELFDRCLWALLSAVVGAGAVAFAGALLPDSWKRRRAVLTGGVMFFVQLLTLAEGCAWMISGKTFSYEFALHLSLNTLRYGMSDYEWAALAAVFYLVLSAVAVGLLNRKSPGQFRRKIALPAGGVALLLLFFLPTPTGEAFRFWVIRPLTRQDTAVTESDYSRFGIKRKIPDRDDVTALPGKNLVLVYLESTENSYLDEERFPNLMPNTRKLLEEAIVFEEIQPSEYATFTFGALFASQSGYDLTDLQLAGRLGNDGVNPAVGNRLSSLPGVLKKAGYFLSFMNSASLNFAGAGVMLSEFGYDDLWAAEALPPGVRKQLGFEGEWGGCRDTMLFRIGAEKYRVLSERGQPFLLALLTIDAHHPNGFVAPDGPVYARPGEDPSQLLTAIHRTDQALGEFVEQLKRQPAWKDTVLFVVTDHLAMNGATTSDLLRENPHRRLLAFALNAGAPRRITVKGKTFDLAPTLLELAGVRHNYLFPLGESLLGNPNPNRLRGDSPTAKPALEQLLLEKSGAPAGRKQDGTVRVTSDPYTALVIDGILMPLFSQSYGILILPEGDECFAVHLSPENRAEKWRRLESTAAIATFLEEGERNLLFGKASGPAGVLTGLSELPPDDYILAVQENGKFRTVHGPRPETLVLPLAQDSTPAAPTGNR